MTFLALQIFREMIELNRTVLDKSIDGRRIWFFGIAKSFHCGNSCSMDGDGCLEIMYNILKPILFVKPWCNGVSGGDISWVGE